MEPAVARAYLAGIEALRSRLTGRELDALVKAGAVDRYISLALSDENLNEAFRRYRAQIQLSTRDAAVYVGRSIPGVPRGTVGVAFDVLSPRVIDGIRALDSRVMRRLATETRETVRAIIEQGLRTGAGPVKTSRAIRDMIGIGPTQVQEVANYRAALEAGKVGKALSYAARDRRFDASVRRGALDAAKIDKMVDAYTARRVAINAAATARTATNEAFRAGQRLSWESAIERGIVDAGRLRRRWMTVMDGRERPEHHEMNGSETGFNEPYPNGDLIIGESNSWNCRCADFVFLASRSL